MVISYHGIACFKVQLGDVVIAFNPISKDSDFKSTRFSSDIAIISLNDKNYNGLSNVSGGSRELFVIDGPGEYEVGGIYVKGFAVEQEMKGNKNLLAGRQVNTIYSVLFDDINLCHLGAMNTANLNADVKEQLGDIDILFTPITGGDLLSSADASKLVNSLEPKVIIPMQNDVNGISKNALSSFLKESGEEDVKPIEKLTIKKKDLEGKEGEVIVLTPII
ncbi:MAG: MBL fold metallo-hydrolase [Candidatus Vogelbacteria bacterium]|nr:MBL fold metallo-hydrolase [Candidatus Vogelbacteria bacterium]